MTTHDMKQQALQKALASEDQRGTVEVVNFNQSWKMTCGCHRLVEFGFYLFRKTTGDDWHPHCEIDEDEAKAFLYGMGQTE